MQRFAYKVACINQNEADRMTVPKIVVAANLQPRCDFIDRLRELAFNGKIALVSLQKNTSLILPEHLEGAKAIVMKPTATKLTPISLSKAKFPFAIGTVSAGTDHLKSFRNNSSISIFNSPGGNSNGTSDLTVSLAKELFRPIRRGISHMTSGIFNQGPFFSSGTLKDKRWLIVGSGHIPAALIYRLSVEGLSKITVVNRRVEDIQRKIEKLFELFPRSAKPDIPLLAKTGSSWMDTVSGGKTQIEFLQVDYSDTEQFANIFSEEDVVSIHIGENPSQRTLFNSDVLRGMRNAPILINAGRASVVDGRDIINALEKKELSGYASDVISEAAELNGRIDLDPIWTRVYEDRNKLEEDRLNIVLLPHIGGSTYEDQKHSFDVVIEKIQDFLGL
jgi:phosphoglycerate dehydrogenase-like enzyme